MFRGERVRYVRSFIATVIAICAMVLGGAPVASAKVSFDYTVSYALDATQGGGFTAPNTFLGGASVRYAIDVTCASDGAECGVATLSDTLDSRLVYGSLESSGVASVTSASGGFVTIQVGTPDQPLKAGESVHMVLVMTLQSWASGGTITSRITAEAGGIYHEAGPVDIVVGQRTPQWRLVKTAPEVAAPGDEVTYRIDLEGSPYGTWGIMNFVLTDTYPAGAVIVDAGGGTVDEAKHTISWPFKFADLDAATGACVAADGWCRPKPYTDGVATVTLRYPADAFRAGQTVTNKASARVTYMSETGGDLAAQATTLLRAPVDQTLTPVTVPPTSPGTPTPTAPTRALPLTGGELDAGLVPVVLIVVAVSGLLVRRRSVG